MGHTVYLSNSEITTAAGFGKVAHVPCIFDSRPGYHRLASAFLIDRCLGIWRPVYQNNILTADLAPTATSAPTEVTGKNFADWLVNFLDWAEIRGVDPLTCEYRSDILGRYQYEMAEGTWSAFNRPLNPNTYNPRVSLACEYISWLANKGYRQTFLIPTEKHTKVTGTPFSSHGHKRIEYVSRVGKGRPDKKHMRMPTTDELFTWLLAVEAKFGSTYALMCETVCLSAVRRSEAMGWRVNTVPEDKQSWHLGNSAFTREDQRIKIFIKFGAKGKTFGTDHGDKIGPKRFIWIPINLADRLHDYRIKGRNEALRKWIKSATSKQLANLRRIDTPHLFLDERSGRPIDSRQLYKAWTGVPLPIHGWSPHKGRDWWACSVLWNELQKHYGLISSLKAMPIELINSTATSIIRLQIQPQLGHREDSTTHEYLQWVHDMLGFSPSIRRDEEDLAYDSQNSEQA